jgi:hypothetical protein
MGAEALMGKGLSGADPVRGRVTVKKQCWRNASKQFVTI